MDFFYSARPIFRFSWLWPLVSACTAKTYLVMLHESHLELCGEGVVWGDRDDDNHDGCP